MTEYVGKLEKQIDKALDRITELEAVKKKSSDEVAYWAEQVSEWAAKCGVSDAEIEALRAENARLLKKNTALKAALEETYKIASRNEDGEYKWQVIKALSEEDYE